MNWRDIPIDTVNCHLAITACGELSDDVERLRAINAELLAALEWIAEDGGVCARAAECARAAIEKAASS